MKRSASNLCGVLAIDKPYGMTSHDVVNKVRHITGERRVGHAGTLDPAATGLMLVGVGAATRLSDYLIGHDKEYVARIVFGATTDTDDAQGRVMKSGIAQLSDTYALADPEQILAEFTGTLDQMPPAYSAIKKNGVIAYKAAREGKCIELESRSITVYEACLLGTGTENVEFNDAADGVLTAELPYWDVHFSVSKGTYIRALARDIGNYVGCGAYLGGLRRTAVSNTKINDACTLDTLEQKAQAGEGLPWCNPADLLGFPVIELNEQEAKYVANGRELDAVHAVDDELVSCVKDGKLLAVYTNETERLKPATVIPGGVVGVV